jgi:hypothetical protein
MRIPRPAVRSRIDLPQEHNCMFICNVIIASDSLKGARVNKGQYVCVYDPKNKNKGMPQILLK